MPTQYTIGGRGAASIAASVELGIRRGRLPAGVRLPPVRRLARDLRVSPGTVASAYRVLRDRGVIHTRVGSGTTVSSRPPLAAPAAHHVPPGVRDLSNGNPDPSLLPSLAGALGLLDTRHHLYDEPASLGDLLDVARRDFRGDGVPAESVTVVSGALDGVERILQAHLRLGDRVAVEDPAYASVLDLLAALGLLPVPMRVDDLGALPGDLDAALREGAAAVLLTPRSQNPFGAAFDEGRARELRSVLRRHAEAVLIEDDHAGPVSGAEHLTLVSRERARWAVVRSVAKSLGPDLRVALLAGDATTVDRVAGRRLLGQGWVSRLLQQVVLALWADSSVDRLLETAARTYGHRRRSLVDALSRRDIAAHGRSGMNVWVPVPEEAGVMHALLESGWAVRAGEPFRLRSSPAIRVTISTLVPEDAERFAYALAGALRPRDRGRPA
ncbi:aminotransferase class I/II-fold pyridoxal phosphate-dependent enzyme [soil metagenome]